MTNATLYVVATPIGNLGDLSERARHILAEVELIASEDTRRTGRLLTHLGITTRQIALHEHNEDAQVQGLIGKLQSGQSVALVSDAGTPLVSDPGYRLLRAAHEHSIPVSPVPGASALVAALSVAGLPTDRFCFEGFLPAKKSARLTRLQNLLRETRTMVFFESVHRIGECLTDVIESFGPGRRAFIGRELTKLHEQCVSATLGELRARIDDGGIATKGEFVLAVEGYRGAESSTVSVDLTQLIEALTAVLPRSQAVDVIAALSGRRRNEIYRLVLSESEDAGSD